MSFSALFISGVLYKESFCYLSLEDEIRKLIAGEGARIGCKLSSFGFALTVQDVYEAVSDFIRANKDGSCIKTATDDVIVIIKAVWSERKAFYEKVNQTTALLRKGAAT